MLRVLIVLGINYFLSGCTISRFEYMKYNKKLNDKGHA